MNNPGQFIMWLGLIAIGISSLSYAILYFNKNHKTAETWARLSFIGFAASVTVSSILLMHAILNHEFVYSYVIRYSSRDLPLIYLFSSFWAGQEGSFLLWVLLAAWLGILVIYTARDMEPEVMLVYNLSNVFLMILLIKQSPFAMVPFPPADGNGLNMLLQDPWMAIHPPIVFLGYAAYAVPFAYAVASWWRRDYDAWIKPGLPWALFAFVTLGAGIIIGGFWSYKVLGWGGYWGWDPVENASLLPWLSGMALMHGMILQKTQKKLRKTNFALASLSFVLVLYCTFLTRSGVLANFSVHSFTDLGITGWLVIFMAAFVGISLWLLVIRAKDVPIAGKGNGMNYFSREFGLIAAMILLCLSCIVTGLGTSAPLITRLLENASKVSTQFYVDTNLPIAILLLLLLSIVPLMTWGQNMFSKLAPKLTWAFIGAAVSAVATLIFGYPGIQILLLSTFGGAVVAMNLFLAIKLIRKKISLSSGAVAHFGVGLMFLGIVSSSVYDRSEKISLAEGEEKDVLGYSILFKGPEPVQEAKGIRVFLPMDVKKAGSNISIRPNIRSERAKDGRINRFTQPHIERKIVSDLYVAPLDFKPPQQSHQSGNHLDLKKGQTVRFGDYDITFAGFDVARMMGQGQQDTHEMTVGADIQVSYKDEEPVLLKPVISVGKLHTPASRVTLPGPHDAALTLVGIDAGNKIIHLDYQGPDVSEKADTSAMRSSMLAEISIKPGMTVLWLGTFLILFGGCIGIARRAGK
jgi:cytochrome c-type biogenesis protein CcmF